MSWWPHKLLLLYSWSAVLWRQTWALRGLGGSPGCQLCDGNAAPRGKRCCPQPVLRRASRSAPAGARCPYLLERLRCQKPVSRAALVHLLAAPSHEAVAWEAPLEPSALGWAAKRGGLSKGKPAPFASPLADLLQPGEDQAGRCTRLFRCSPEGTESAKLLISFHPPYCRFSKQGREEWVR